MRFGKVVRLVSLALVAALGVACGSGGATAPAAPTTSGQGTSAPAGQPATGDPYKIGVTGALAGAGGTAIYAANVEGLRVYLEKLNASGGINGHPVRLIPRDNQVNPTTAASDAQAFVQEKVHAITIFSPSVTFPPVVEVGERAKIPVVQVVSGCDKQTSPPSPRPHFFCVGSAPATVVFDVEYVAEQARQGGGKKLLFIASETPASRFPIDSYGLPRAKELGLEADQIVLPVNLTQTDAEAVASRIAGQGVDWVISYAATRVHLFGVYEALARQGWPGKYLVLSAGDGEKQVGDLKAPNLYAFTKTAPFFEDLPVHREIQSAAERFSAKYPADQLAYGWAIGIVLEQALKECGWPCSSEQLLGVMAKLRVSGDQLKQIWGNDIIWTANNHIAPAEAYKLYRWDPAQSKLAVVKDWTAIEVK